MASAQSRVQLSSSEGGSCGAQHSALFPRLPSYDGTWFNQSHFVGGGCTINVAWLIVGTRRQIGATVYSTSGILVHTFGGSRPV